MIKVIKVNRYKVILGALVLLGIVCCAVGFGGAGEKLLGGQEKSLTPASVSISQPEQQAGIQPISEMGTETGGDTNDVNDVNSAGDTPAQPDPAMAPQWDSAGAEEFFVEYRMDRERARGKQVELLREVMASSSIDEETRKNAHEKFLSISSSISKEMELENLIRARGFKDAAVFLDSDSVTVVVQPGQQTFADSENSVIAELVSKSAGVAEENVIIITKEQ